MLIASPRGEVGPHLRALESISHSLRDDGFVHGLLKATTREAIARLLDEADQRACGLAAVASGGSSP
jgi:mannitol/fructose-specific phosphotransferase system IIA component (Ntr-type)